MTRTVIVAAAVVVIVVVGSTIWFTSKEAEPPEMTSASEAPQHFDTTGGQEMRPRWKGGPSDDTSGN